jgi:hypothetical protein
MTSHEKPGFLRRLLNALGRALRRGLLGKSSHAYLKQFTDNGDDGDRASATQRGRPEPQASQPEPAPRRRPDTAAVHAAPGLPGAARRVPESDSEPVHGWSERQREDYLLHNPGYRSTYEAALQEHRHEPIR